MTELSLTINDAMATGRFDFIFFDSIDGLLVYNNENITQKFSRFIINKIKAQKIGGMLLTTNSSGQSKSLINMLSQFCDATIQI